MDFEAPRPPPRWPPPPSEPLQTGFENLKILKRAKTEFMGQNDYRHEILRQKLDILLKFQKIL